MFYYLVLGCRYWRDFEGKSCWIDSILSFTPTDQVLKPVVVSELITVYIKSKQFSNQLPNFMYNIIFLDSIPSIAIL